MRTTRSDSPPRPGRAFAAALLVVALASAGCATRPDGSSVTLIDDLRILTLDDEGLGPEAARQLARAQMYARMRRDAALLGGIAGTAAGASLSGQQRLLGGLVGAVVGMSAGYLAGAYIGRLNEVAENRREELTTRLEIARAAVAEHGRALADVRAIHAQEAETLSRLQNAYRAGRITADAYRGEIAGLERKLRILDEVVRTAEQDLAVMEQHVADGERQAHAVADLARQRDSLKGVVEEMRGRYGELLSAAAGIPPEIGGPRRG